MSSARPKPLATILVIEDDPVQFRLYREALRDYSLKGESNVTAALAGIRTAPPDLIILDHVLSNGEKGADFLLRLREVVAHVPIVMVSGTLDIQARLEALQGANGAHYVLEKPVDIEELESVVEAALRECGVGEAIRVLKSLEQAEKTADHEPDSRFTERLVRQHNLLQLLRGAVAPPNISHLARQHQVSRRTIIRDLRELVQRGQLDPAVYPAVDPTEGTDSKESAGNDR